jgi:outer membrane protein insertion porin family
LTAAFTVDTRNSLWNARNGLFFSHSFMYAGKWLGSELNFYRYMGQVNYYRPVTGNLISASSLQMGLGKSLGHRLIPGERFFAGGANSLRGYKYRSVGGFDSVTGEPLGGEAMMLLRQELRLDLGDWPGPVVFLDLGNIYSRASDFAPFKLRTAAGFGLRYTAAGLLLRLDWGFKLDRKPGESPSHIYFSIGQSF